MAVDGVRAEAAADGTKAAVSMTLTMISAEDMADDGLLISLIESVGGSTDVESGDGMGPDQDALTAGQGEDIDKSYLSPL